MFDCIVIVDPRLRGAEERAFMTFLTTLTEAAAVTAVYAIVVETVLHRDMSVTRDLPRAAE